MTHLKAINKALKQLEFLKDVPDQKGVVTKIAETLKEHFIVSSKAVPYFIQIVIRPKAITKIASFKEGLHYAENNKNDHRTRAFKNALLKAKEYYAREEISTTDS